MSAPREPLEPILALLLLQIILLIRQTLHVPILQLQLAPRLRGDPQLLHMRRRDDTVPRPAEHEDGELRRESGDLVDGPPPLRAEECDVPEDGPAFDDVGDGGERVLDDEGGDLGRVKFSDSGR